MLKPKLLVDNKSTYVEVKFGAEEVNTDLNPFWQGLCFQSVMSF